ncbi:hypothetical_protein [Leishmania braziliensis MHOM/BR/75/M2904]|uniref:Hypothetical_protein n=1 Tax=Leishmania braziliensis MHOM/BR/75/M2904 TaxID=420245 RepID=A0A3P3ZHF8_LEIBR|nr:unnamed protein product [Leishmania braziliensis]CAJ2481044.1 unnamed protein product [Leishmania braziliensis]SYZ69693.1 hypothetical_protein [Leishmania braziliensis MHOM/BR/75/M2904]
MAFPALSAPAGATSLAALSPGPPQHVSLMLSLNTQTTESDTTGNSAPPLHSVNRYCSFVRLLPKCFTDAHTTENNDVTAASSLLKVPDSVGHTSSSNSQTPVETVLVALDMANTTCLSNYSLPGTATVPQPPVRMSA